MKKFAFLFLSIILFATGIFSTTTITVNGAEIETYSSKDIVTESVEFFDDGSYATTTVYEESYPLIQSLSYSKVGTKAYVMRNKDGEELWRFTVHATFSVNPGVSSAARSVSHTISISESAWQTQSAVTTYSGNKAVGDASFIKKILFITVETRTCNVVLICDKNGNLS